MGELSHRSAKESSRAAASRGPFPPWDEAGGRDVFALPALVLGTALSIRTLPATPAPVSPFATLDVVKLAAATPGVLPEQGLSRPQGPGLRFGAEKG